MFVIEGKNIAPHFFNDNFRSKYRMMAMPILSCGLLRDIQYIDDIGVIKKCFMILSVKKPSALKKLVFTRIKIGLSSRNVVSYSTCFLY